MAMTSMEMRQLEAGSELVTALQPPHHLTASSASPAASASAGHSTDDLSNCGSKLNLLEVTAGSCRSSSSRGLHYSNPSCDLLPASANTHQPAASNEATFNAAAATSSPPHLSAEGKKNNEKSFMSRWILRNLR